MRRRDHNIFANATSLLICGLLAGVVVAAAAFPAVAMSGLAAKAGGQTFAQLPGQLRDFSSPQITRIFASDNKTQIAVMYDEFRSDVPLKDIAKTMQDAIIAAEDREFYTTTASTSRAWPGRSSTTTRAEAPSRAHPR